MDAETPIRLRLDDATLLRRAALLRAADSVRSTVTDPATGAVLATVPALGAAEADMAVSRAAQAWPAWRGLSTYARAAALARWSALIRAHAEDLARIATAEQGKPLAEARGEVEYAASFPEWFAAESQRIADEMPPPHLPDCRVEIRRVPVGIVAAATPWNFPLAMLTRKAGAALAAGCPIVVHPAEETPLSALALAELAERAGVPADVMGVVTGAPEPIVGTWCADRRVSALSFTGSTEIGRRLLAACAPTIKRVQLELGGHAPFIVFDDVTLEEAVAGAIAAKFATSGQDCLAANRIYIHRALYARFLEAFTAAVTALPVGSGFDPASRIGPLMHARAAAKCEAHVADAVANGARLLTGGSRHKLGGTFFAPTVLADVTPGMRIYREETFGPVAAVLPFEPSDDIAAMANDSDYGLAAYLYTRDAARIARLVEALDYGLIGVNRVRMTGPPVPFGGMKQSGLGREGSRLGIEAFSETKTICLAA